MRFGIFDHMEMRPGTRLGALYAERLEMLEVADEAGFWCYHKAEHHFTPLDAAPSANVFLAAASQRTARIRFGALVYLLPFYDPIRLAEELCALDHLSGGRLEIGVGKGISPAEHRLFGLDPEEARARFEDAFAVLRACFAGATLSHDGPYHRYAEVPLLMRPLQSPQPPLWYPGNVEYAGSHRLNTVVGGPPEAVASALARYRELLATAEDWNPGAAVPLLGATRHVYVAASDDEARARAAPAYRRYHDNLATLFERYRVPFPNGDPSLGGDAALAERVGALVVGSPETVRADLEALREASGVDYVINAFAWGDLEHHEVMASLRLFTREVMPAFG